MITVDEKVYTKVLPDLIEWFKNVHPGNYEYQIHDLEDTHLKLVDLVDRDTHKIYFRVLLDSTYENVRQKNSYPVRPEEVNWLTNTPTDNKLLHNWGTARQVCIIQLDRANKPIDEVLFTYSSENKFVKIEKHYSEKN